MPRHSRSKLAKDYRSIRTGPGGWHCRCCNPYYTDSRFMKVKARRKVRRTEKLNNDLTDNS